MLGALVPRYIVPVLGRDLSFPPVESARRDGLLAIGGDLSVERLLLAYRHGIFPWYDEDSPILWWSPPQRAVVRPQELHVPRSLRKVLRRGTFEVRFDSVFPDVIRACASVPRADAAGTWIVPLMQAAYAELHRAGFAHSIECFQDGGLVGGLYGVSLGGCFFGESMFSLVSDASKVAMVTLAEHLAAWQFDLIDCQLMNDNVQRFGAQLIPRASFLERLTASLQRPTRAGPWRPRPMI